MAPSGEALAVWSRFSDGRVAVWASHHSSAGAWGEPQRIELDESGDAFDHQVAVSPSGSGLATWVQHLGDWGRVWARPYVPGSGWGQAQLLSAGGDNAAWPAVAAGHDAAFAAWVERINGRYAVWSSRYTPDAGWGPLQQIDISRAGHSNLPQIAVDTYGRALAVWAGYDGVRHDILYNTYEPGVGWGQAQLLEHESGDAMQPKVVLSAEGQALVVWLQEQGGQQHVRTIQYIPGIGWGEPQNLDLENSGEAAKPRVALGLDGTGLAVWLWQSNTQDAIAVSQFE
ncbi:MAG TPA: hypothetical protein VNA24_35985 [Hyalangium sp.]|nr:hypothetical protein [Hyalangium sp.]